MKKVLLFIGRLVILLISGYVFGVIAKNNLLIGIILLIVGLSYLIWSFSKNTGWFKEDKTFIKLALLSFSKSIGFILGFFNILNIYGLEDRYKFAIFLTILFLYALTIGLKEAYNLMMHKK
ncbi:hypothetical protein J4477_04760 [Candidatus Pacearchaeota archaeon]|nr:hypothetical protein [Candidatus Pacearchaeota archaeon]